MEYNTDYFINKFEKTKDKNWCTGRYFELDKFCALGWCGEGGCEGDFSYEAKALMNLFRNFDLSVIDCNDGESIAYQQPTPKQRILAALYDIKANEAVKEVQEIVNQSQSIEQKAEVTTESEIVSQ